MTRTLSVEEEIQRPAAEVWEALTDWKNAHRWMPGIEGMTAEGETAGGTKLTFRARGADRSSEIVHCDAGNSIVLRSVQGGVSADYRYELHDLGGRSTRVTLVADCQVTGSIVAHRIAPASHRHPPIRRQAAEAAEGDDRGSVVTEAVRWNSGLALKHRHRKPT